MNQNFKIAIAAALAAAALSLGGQVLAQNARKLEEQFKAAQYKADVDGDLPGAIADLEQIADTRGVDPALVSRALLAMGDYQASRRNDAEARKTYERIVKDYSEQPAAAEARERLGRLFAGAAPFPKVHGTRICADCSNNGASISVDGRLMLTNLTASGSASPPIEAVGLGIRDLASLQMSWLIRPVPGEGGARGQTRSTGSPSNALLSRDGTRVVYCGAGGQLGLIASKPGGEPRVLISGGPGDAYYPAAWSADNRSVLVLRRVGGAWDLAWVSAADGALVRVIKADDGLNPYFENRMSIGGLSDRPSLSPDGKFVAYSKGTRTDRHIYVLAADGSGPETPLVKRGGINESAVWTPDSRQILFISDFNGSFDLWSVAVNAGKPAGLPAVVWKDTGRSAPAGITSAGMYYFTKARNRMDHILVTEMESGGAHIRGATPKILERFIGDYPRWSPDGKFLAYLRRTEDPNKDTRIVYSIERGRERVFPHPARPAVWFQDSKAFLETGDESGSRMVYRVEVATGEFMPLHTLTPGAERLVLSPDDKTLYWLERFTVMALHFDTGQTESVFPLPYGQVPSVAMAMGPDGALAIYATGANTHLGVLTRSGKDYRYQEIYSGPGARYAEGLGQQEVAWTKNGHGILFQQCAEGGIDSTCRLSHIPRTGGAPEPAGLWGRQQRLSLSSDGARLAYVSSELPGTDLWALDLSALMRRSQ